MEIIWSIEGCQLQKNEDIISLDISSKYNYYQSHSFKKFRCARNENIIYNILKFCNTFCNTLKVLQYILQYLENLQYFESLQYYCNTL